jgi:uncharacterized membrane protein SpoIIM required for sporulation
MKIKFFKIKKDYKKENYKINPNIYWKVTLIVLFFLMVGSFIFSYNLFVKTNKDEEINTENNSDKIGNKEEEKIKDALEYFSEREKKSAEILNSSSTIVDPSI